MSTAARGMPGKSQPAAIPFMSSISASQQLRSRDVPPPSTLAAQLITTVSVSSKAPNAPTSATAPAFRPPPPSKHHGSTASATPDSHFQQLVHEVAHFEDRGAADTPYADRLAHHHKLIYVIAVAVLDVLSRGADDPFQPARPKLVGQAAEALDVLNATVRETPEVLVRPAIMPTLGGADQQSTATASAPPIWLWLLPKILVLAGRDRCEELQHRIVEFIASVVAVVARTPQVWHLAPAMFAYLRECADASFSRMACFTITSSSNPLVLPPASVEGRIDLRNPTGLESCTYTMRSVPHVFQHARCLLLLLSQICARAAAASDSMVFTRDYVWWIVESAASLRDLEKRWKQDLGLKKRLTLDDTTSKEAVFTEFSNMVVVQSLLSRDFIPDWARRRVAAGFCTLCVAFLDAVKDASDVDWGGRYEQSMQAVLSGCFLDLALAAQTHASLRRPITVALIPAVKNLEERLPDYPLGNDMKHATAVLERVCTDNPTGVTIDFEDERLRQSFQKLQLPAEPASRPAKRQKREHSLVDRLSDQVCVAFCHEDKTVVGLDGLKDVVESGFARLDEPGRCAAIEMLCYLPCASAGTVSSDSKSSSELGKLTCAACDSNEKSAPSDSILRDSENILAAFDKLTSSTAFLESRRPRVLAMFGIRRFATHFKNPGFQNLETSLLGQWCLKSLQSSLRELRIAAGRVLARFLQGCQNDKIEAQNWKNVLDILQTLSTVSPLHLQETTILAWGQIARVAKIEHMNLVLHRLVEYLGHTNLIVSGVAFSEIVNLASATGQSTSQLFAPYWRNIAVTAVKDLQSKPQTAQLLADLMGYSVSDLLLETQSFTLPSLILMNRKETVLRIWKLRNDDDPVSTIMESNNLPPIMALLLVQRVSDLETFIMSLLRSISKNFDESDLVDLLNSEPVGIAFELFTAAGEETDANKARILASNHILNSDGKKSGTVGMFLEAHVLGLLARFSERINDPRLAVIEKLRCLKGLEEMFLVGKGHIKSALPQICGGLQSALSQDDLRHDAFSAWTTMFMNLDAGGVSDMLESTFATITLYYDSFGDETKSLAAGVITHLLSNHDALLEEMVDYLPSLGHIPEFASFEQQLHAFRSEPNALRQYTVFKERITAENEGIVKQALTELVDFLQTHQSFLQTSAVSEQPDKIVGDLTRAIIDACVKFNSTNNDIALLSAQCIGLIGCLDPNRVEAVRDRNEMVVVGNFDWAEETTDFVLFLLQEVLVKAFLTTSNPKAQGFLSFAMQELLDRCDISAVCADRNSVRGNPDAEALLEKWLAVPENVRATLAPFLSSRYVLTELVLAETQYPIFKVDKMYPLWVKTFVLDLLQKPHNKNAELIFAPICRVLRIADTSIANFMLPFAALHAIAAGTDKQREDISEELLLVLRQRRSDVSHTEWENLRLCSEAVFRVLDYLSRWIQHSQARIRQSRAYDRSGSANEVPSTPAIEQVSSFLARIPAELISTRAVECKSFARALFHWEQYIRQTKKTSSQRPENVDLRRLQEIYTEIDEPDGIDGLSTHLDVLDIRQQVLGHKKAGRWAAAQSWYEIELAQEPAKEELQVNLLTCLKQSSQHDVLLNYAEGMQKTPASTPRLLPFITEACWATNHWDTLAKYLAESPADLAGDFNVNVGRTLLALHNHDNESFTSIIQGIREQIASNLSFSTTYSLGGTHDAMLKLHVLSEIEMIAGNKKDQRNQLIPALGRRLEVLGSYHNDKQYLLSIRRAVMQLCKPEYSNEEIATAWLTSARLSRKGGSTHQSFNAVLHASQLSEESATLEHARLLWKEGHSRQAIQTMQGVLSTPFFRPDAQASDDRKYLTARANLLLAKWLDSAGQTHSTALRKQYSEAAKTYPQWEKGHYYLGRHYNKLLESERVLAPEHQAHSYLTGETAKLVVENYLRSMSYGTKYIYQTLPRILTLWLDLGTQVNQQIDPKFGFSKEFVTRITNGRKDQLVALHTKLSKYIQKIPAYMFYTALPQIVARITHPNAEVYKYLQQILIKVVSSHPQQALWSLLAVSTSMQPDRKARGCNILSALRNLSSKKADITATELRNMIKLGERLSDQLLTLCNAGDFQGNRTYHASLRRDLGFNQTNCTPNPLAVPAESALTATLPTLTDNVRSHKAFSRDVVTISSFLDEVLVLSSLQKPRKIMARGSDGRVYGLLCKPKDDLRKDQRLMEFNGMINRYLKRDAESSKRQLYIKTYAVTPLNEECGIIEWVDGLKTLRDILLGLYKAKGISPNYSEIKQHLDLARSNDNQLSLFTNKVLSGFPPVFYEWFVQQFPEPSSWFAARLKYTRSCAVMSMVGTILGLGDRHGENILFEEGNGGTFHVDFNCLFDKGLTFAQPERVPFRLTHNMVDAMGVYGYEGPFRKSSELTLALLRQHEETLMTVLEAFVYDPTLDLLAKKQDRRRRESAAPDTPQAVLDSIRRKVRGLLAGESVPLGVEGQVDELIQQAVSQKNLAAMYIGWCAFF